MTKTDLILDAIAKAERYESKLTEGPLAIGGYTGKKIRHLLNNLGSISTNYLEVGVYLGSTFVSANYKNTFETSTAIDNFSQFNESGEAKDTFTKNCRDYIDRYLLLDQDCWSVTPDLYKPIDFYLYDGGHGFEEQRQAITHFLPSMAPEFIMCIDDANWNDVKNGTNKGLEESNCTILFDKLLGEGIEGDGDGYWNGFRTLIIRK